MMSSDNHNNNILSKPETQKKARAPQEQQQPPPQSLKCPRCDSPNTKFCYYNNYSLTQPRHFCKTCRRYWTKGGALRNVPIGGGCRKNKKIKSSSSSSSCSRFSSDQSKDYSSIGSPSEIGGLKFYHGLSHPFVDFQLGGLSFPPFADNNNTTTTTITPNCFSLEIPSSGGNLEPNNNNNNNTLMMGFNGNYPLPSGGLFGGGGGGGATIQEMGGLNINSNIASSIESLSSINQDLHWRLQQQRLAMLFGSGSTGDHHQKHVPSSEKPQPILFQNLEISKPDHAGNSRSKDGETATEWFFGNNSYAPMTATGTTATTTPTNSNGNIDHHHHHQNTSNSSSSNWNNNNNSNGVQAWNGLHQFSSLN